MENLDGTVLLMPKAEGLSAWVLVMVHALAWAVSIGTSIFLVMEISTVDAANDAAVTTSYILSGTLGVTLLVVLLHSAYVQPDEWWSPIITAVLLALMFLGMSLASCMFSHAMSLGDQTLFGLAVATQGSIATASGIALSFMISWARNK
jgi:hypothetical protein